MASELTLDRADPGINEIVADWSDGAEYVFDRVRVRQKGTDPKTAKFEVIGVEGGEPAEPEAEDESEGEYPAETPSKAPSKPMGKPALTIAFHK